METAYRTWEKRRQERSGGHRTAPGKRAGGKVSLGPREKRRLVQLAVCVALFLLVFIGKGVFPEQIGLMRDKVLGIIQTDTDFKAAFSSLGHSISAGEPVLGTLGELWVDVFGGGTAVTVTGVLTPERTPTAMRESAFLTGYPEAVIPAVHWVGVPPAPALPAVAQTPVLPPTPVPVKPVEPVVVQMPYNGPAFPESATMDKYNLSALGIVASVTPAMGQLTSSFGWREHPVDGGEKFHNGVDVAVNNGTAVGAFAGGVVEYIGESPIYGQYLQLKHAGGLTSFYAHCSRLCVTQGQMVTAGEKVAESGDTGNATGPHLHFELKLFNTQLNPLYYIQTA